MIDSVHIFVIALLVFVFGLASRAFSRTVITAPLAFVAFGMFFAPEIAERLALPVVFHGLGHLEGAVHLVGEITLVVVLFTDAAQIQIRSFIRGAAIPIRMLAIGMPLTILLGAGLALPFFPELGVWELLLLATMLAPTDAALGQAVVTSERVPLRIRQGLSVESGLNDGIAVPLVVMFASFASIGGEMHGAEMTNESCAVFAGRQLLLGPLVGMLVGAVGAWLMTVAVRRRLMEHAYQELAGIALAIIAFVVAGQVGGNGFIAAFVAGLVVGNSSKEVCSCLYDFAEAEAQLLMLTTFFLVGLTFAWDPLMNAGWQAWAYAGLSLTIIRMLPIALSLIGLHLRIGTISFLGWFGPRGLASVIFAVLVIEELPVPHSELIVQIVMLTVLLSVLLHGITAAPMSAVYAKFVDRHTTESCPENAGHTKGLIRKSALESTIKHDR